MTADTLAKVIEAAAAVCVFVIAVGLFGAVVRANDPEADDRDRWR